MSNADNVNTDAEKSKTEKSKLDALYPLGLFGGVMALIGAGLVDGTSPLSFVNLAALCIVFGGTISATVVQHPLRVVVRSLAMLRWAITPPYYEPSVFIEQLIELAHKSRKYGLLSLDALIDDIEDPFMRNGLRMAVDGTGTTTIMRTLRLRLHTQTELDMMAAGLFEAAGGYAPTFGIMGAVTGLIEVMHHLSHPSELGMGIAAAFVSTVYGLVLANVFCIPTANRLRTVIAEQLVARNVFMDALHGIVTGINTLELRTILESYYLPNKKSGETEDSTAMEPA